MRTYKGMLIIGNDNGKVGVFDKNLKIVVPFEYDDISGGTDDEVIAKKDGINGYLNIATNEFTPNPNIIDFITEEELIEESYKQIRKKGNKYGITDENGNFTLLPVYDAIEPWNHAPNFYVEYADGTNSNLEQRYLIYKDGKIGVASDSQVLTTPIYDEIDLDEIASDTPYPAFIAQKDNLYGYINNDGEPLTDFIYSSLFFPNLCCIGQCIRDDINCIEFVNLETKKIIYTDKNRELINHSVMRDHLVVLTKNDKYRVYDSNGKLIAEFNNTNKLKSAEIEYLNDKVLCYKLENNSNDKVRYGLVNYSGEILTDATYSHFISFMNSDLIVGNLIFGNKSTILDSCGNVIKGNLFGAGGCGIYKNGLSQLPIMYWKDEKSIDMECYPETQPTEEELLNNSIYELFKDEKNSIIVTDYGEPYVFVGRENEVCVYDKDKNLLNRVDFIMEKVSSVDIDELDNLF